MYTLSMRRQKQTEQHMELKCSFEYSWILDGDRNWHIRYSETVFESVDLLIDNQRGETQSK